MGRRRRTAAWLETALRIAPGELRLALLLFLLLHALVGAFVVGRSVRDTLFLSQVSPAALPWVYILSSAAVAAFGAGYARFGSQRPLDAMLPATALFFAGTLAAARLALSGAGAWLPAGLYAWVEVMGSITLIQFWSFASVLCDSRQAKRLFGIAAAGGTTAATAAGFAVGALARRGGTPALLWLGVGYLAAAAGVAAIAARAAGPRSWSVRPPRAGVLAPPASPGRDLHLQALALLTVLTFLAVTFVDYQFKVAAAARFGRNPGELARFFGFLTAGTSLVGLALQLGLVGKVLERSGVVGALAILPAALGIGSAATLAAPGLWTATFSKAAELGIRYTASDSATQLLYVPLAPLRRARTKAFVDGVVRPATVAAAGAVLLFHPPGALRPLALAALLLSVLWLLSLGVVHRRYLDALRQALRRGRLDLAAAPRRFGSEAARALRRALASPDAAEVEGALALAPLVRADLSAEMAALLAHPSPRTRALACDALARAEGEPAAGEVARLLSDPEAEVRAAAAGATLRIGKGPGGEAREVVAALGASPRVAERLLAARALAAAGPGAPTEMVAALLADPEPAVCRAALGAAGRARDPALLPLLLGYLARRDTARAAAEALAAWGPGAEPALARVLGDPAQDPALRRRTAGPLGRLATPEAVRILLLHADAADAALRGAVARGLAQAALRHPGMALDRDRLAAVLRWELERAWWALAAAEALDLPEGDERMPVGPEAAARHLLGSALRQEQARAVDRALALARVLRPDADVDLARARLADVAAARRATALELLDTVLDGSLRRRIVPLLDDRPRADRLREAEGPRALPRPARLDWLAAILGDGSPWLVAAACHAAGELQEAGAAPRLRELLQHPVPYVREAALAALSRLLSPAEAAAAGRALAADPFAPARQRALALAARAAAEEAPR